jgi:hypothetical protein
MHALRPETDMSAPHPWYRQPPVEQLPGSHAAPVSDVRPADPVARFLGGPPLAVFMRLLFVSLLVGAFLMWFDIRPFDIFWAIRRMIDRLWDLGWDAVRQVVEYVAAGAVIVVPCWLILRLTNYRGPR